MTDRFRVVFGAGFVCFGVLAVVLGGGAFVYAWYSALAWSQTEAARQVERAAAAPPPIWLDDDADGAGPGTALGSTGAAGAVAELVEEMSGPGANTSEARTTPGSHDGTGTGGIDAATRGRSDGVVGPSGASRAASGSTVFVPPQLRHVLDDAERELAATPAGPPPRRATANDVGVADVDFRFLDPPEPGAHARLQLAVRNRADVPTGPVSVTIPARWFESFDVVGAVPNVLVDRTEQDGLRYFDYPAIGPAETVSLELHVLATNEDLDAPEVRVALRDEEAELARVQPRTVAPKPRPGPARQVQIPSLNIRAGVVPTAWEPPEFVVGQIADSAAVSLGNTVLVGHLSGPAGNVFNRLDRAKLGDEVTAVSRGVEYRFLVSDVVVLPNNDRSMMLPTETPRLTLMTCAGAWNPFRQDYSHRLWVIAELPELAEKTIAANRERAARAAEELARVQAEAERAEVERVAADATATAIAEAALAEDASVAGTPVVGTPVASIPVEVTPQAGTISATPAATPMPPAPVAETVRPAAKPDDSGNLEATLTPPTAQSSAPPIPRQATGSAPSATSLRLPQPLLVAILEPGPDARVPQRVTVRGELVGETRPSGHLWLAVRADVEGSRWYLFGQEITPSHDGRWELELELGGPPDVRHEIRLGSVDQSAHAGFLRHVAERPGEPLAELPEAFEPQATVTVVRR